MALNGYQTGDKGCNNQQKTSAFNEWGIEHDVRAMGSMCGGGRFDRFHGNHVSSYKHKNKFMPSINILFSLAR